MIRGAVHRVFAYLCVGSTLAAISYGQDASAEMAQLKAQVAEQQKQIEQLRMALEEQRKMLSGLMRAGSAEAVDTRPGHFSGLGQVASATPMIPPAPAPIINAQKPAAEEASPLQFHIGNAYITPVGFMDFTSVWRSHDVGSGIGTNFAGIPYGNVFQNKLSEFRLSMQNSRIGFRVDALVKGAHVIGYMESDFLGNNPGNVAVSSNSNTMRSRLYWVDVQKNKWEVLGGQTWSLMTPGRTGISPLPGNLFYSQDIDVNYQLGLTWGRIPELRVVFRPTNKAALAVALESPEQYAGGSAGGGAPTFPAALTSTYPGGELNNGGTTLGVPNFSPDLIAKLALDPTSKFHFETGGVLRSFKVWSPVNGQHYTKPGGGGFVNLNFETLPGLRLYTNNFWSDGGGRYIFGQAPDLIARADGSISPVHASSTVDGFEFTKGNTLLYSYYGGMYVGRNVAIDTNGKLVGYGYFGSPAGQNRAVEEITGGVAQTFWKDARYGALTLMGQYSYVFRNPWYFAPAQPEDAHLNMIFMNLRYTLPGSAPAMK